MMRDGTYDVIVVDVKENDGEVIHIEFAITSGAQRGELVTVVTTHLVRPSLELLGTPATLFVDNGTPRIEWS
jgi:hypothetical protein